MFKKYSLYLHEDIEFIYYPEYIEDDIICIVTVIEIETKNSNRKSINFTKKYIKDFYIDINGYINELTGKRNIKNLNNLNYSESLDYFFCDYDSLYFGLLNKISNFYNNRNNILKKEIEENNKFIFNL